MISTAALKALFLLDPEVVFLNHGSFGATPRPVFEAYQDWQRRLERQPVLFLGRELDEHLRAARRELGTYLGADPNDLTFVPNATFGVNMVARSLVLRPGDEVLASDHEYGACNHVWEYLCGKTGARYVRQPIPFPAGSAGEIAEQFWRGVTEHTRVIFLSHITSPTALRLPVEMICQRAQAAGILTLIDGAHAPGQIPLDLEALAADFYVGNLHKWALCPKGAAFLYARRHRQDLVEPLVISWGWGADEPSGPDSPFVNRVQWWGNSRPGRLSVRTGRHPVSGRSRLARDRPTVSPTGIRNNAPDLRPDRPSASLSGRIGAVLADGCCPTAPHRGPGGAEGAAVP